MFRLALIIVLSVFFILNSSGQKFTNDSILDVEIQHFDRFLIEATSEQKTIKDIAIKIKSENNKPIAAMDIYHLRKQMKHCLDLKDSLVNFAFKYQFLKDSLTNNLAKIEQKKGVVFPNSSIKFI